jgi:hypothetical protein
MSFKLVCQSVNERHTKFTLFDDEDANCGKIVILTTDVRYFIAVVWNGKVEWQDHWKELPEL